MHFSACDREGIIVSDHTRDLRRYQINYQKDKTLWWADGPTDGTNYGGELIPLIYDRALVLSNYQILHPGGTEEDHDFHADSKSMKQAWKALFYLRNNSYPYIGDWMKISSTDLMKN